MRVASKPEDTSSTPMWYAGCNHYRISLSVVIQRTPIHIFLLYAVPAVFAGIKAHRESCLLMVAI